MTNVRELCPDATLCDVSAMALFAWHAILSTNPDRKPAETARLAYAHADAMFSEVIRQESVKPKRRERKPR
jgi:hypothetical protein